MNDECSSFLHCIHCSFTQCGVGVMINSNMRVFYEFMKKLIYYYHTLFSRIEFFQILKIFEDFVV